DPFDELEWGHVPVAGAADVRAAVAAARAAFPGWSRTALIQRVGILDAWARLIREHAGELARLQVHENGKTITEMGHAAGSAAMSADYFGHLAMSSHGVVVEPFFPGYEAWTRREPLGVVAAIAPWNNPLALLAWKLFPALATGNTVVVKPSEVTPVSTLLLARLGIEAGIPAGVINVVTGAGESGRLLADDPDIDKIAFTGSTAVGKLIARSAADRLLRTTLELGGKGPNIVFADADLDRAVPGLLTGIIAGTGQACNAGSRLLIADEVYEEVVVRLKIELAKVRIGDPLDPTVIVGPLASGPHFAKVCSYLDLAAEEGHTLLAGGQRANEIDGVESGFFVQPTIFATDDPHARLVQEEIFGPVGAVIRFSTEEEAIRIANDIPFGLVAGLWTQNVDRAHRVSRQLQAGTIWINTWRVFSPNVPFGGMKMSGLGREQGIDALDEYTETKATWLAVAES
ncbi:MAG: aldehyde dehydrogenase, partial [Frondihabitans sp.]|nr:aldehyde dehydrogenase [Frondihabitans sp.]